jgi:hypothetical protein
MSSDVLSKMRRLLQFPRPQESAEEQAFIDRYLALADKLLTPNLERETPEGKTQPYYSGEEETS